MAEQQLTITDRVRAIIARELNLSAETLEPSAHLCDDLGADSLDHVELVMDLEKEFNITIHDEDAETLKTVGDVEAYIARVVRS